MLAFPPLTSPTHVPLGLATLAPYIRASAPRCALRLLDLNLEAHCRLAPPGVAEFFQGRSGDFFCVDAYREQAHRWAASTSRLVRLMSHARRFVETGELDGGLQQLLDPQVELLLASDPTLVGLSVLFPQQLIPALALTRRMKQHATPRVYLGGASMSAIHVDDLLQACPDVDGVLVGEGEPAAGMLFDGSPPDQVPGLVFRGPAGVQRNRAAHCSSLVQLPPPDFSDLPLDRYWNPTPVLGALYSRGCRWRRCRFCSHNLSFAGYRHKTVSQLVQELCELQQRHHASHFYFTDQYIEPRDLECIARELSRRQTGIRFHVLGRPVAAYSRARLEAIHDGGCRWIGWGVETGSQRLLDLMGKGVDARVAAGVVRDAAAAGISNMLLLIFGLPTSTDADLDQTLRLIEQLHPLTDSLTASQFVLFHRTPLARRPARFQLQVVGTKHVLKVGQQLVRSTRLIHRDLDGQGEVLPNRGEVELRAWEQRCRWLGQLPFVDELCAEHYLLFVAHDAVVGRRPTLPCDRAA